MINNKLGNMKYITLSSTTEPSNKPYEYIQGIWETLPLNTMLFANVVNGSWYSAIIQKYIAHSYGSIIIFGYGLEKPIYGRIVNGVWQSAVNL